MHTSKHQPGVRHGPPLLLSLFLLSLSHGAIAQNLEERLREVGSQYGAGYVAPLADGIGATFNSGWFQSTRAGRVGDGLRVHFGVRLMAMPLASGDDTFDLTYRGTESIQVDIGPRTVDMRLPATYEVSDAPTLFGSTDPGQVQVHVRHDTTVSYLGVLLPVSVDTSFAVETVGGLTESLNTVPFAVLQGGIGSFFGTSLLLRWLPSLEIEDLGRTGFFGVGLRHDLTRYVPLLPIRLAVQGGWQRAQITNDDGDEVLRTTALVAGLEGSMQFGQFTLFGGVQAEEARLRIEYRELAEGESSEEAAPVVDLDLRGINTMRFVLGGALNVGVLDLYGDISLGNRAIFSLGLGVSL